MQTRLRWGILSTGKIATRFATALAASRYGELVAVASRTAEAADRFAARFDVPRRHAPGLVPRAACPPVPALADKPPVAPDMVGYESLLCDPEVDAVYIATPHPMHAEWAIRAAEAGKHVLCEKPLTLNEAEAALVIEAARANDVFLMEAFMYRCHPQTHRLVELIRGGIIGEVRVIQATFSFASPYDPASRVYANALGGGGILDVGCYCISMARLIAGAAAGRDFAEPVAVAGAGHVGPTGVDHYAIALLTFPGDVVAALSAGVAVEQENVVRVFGTRGHIFVPVPWTPGAGADPTYIHVHVEGRQPESIEITPDRPLFAIEADVVAEHISRRQAPAPAMSWDDTLGNMRTLDRWRAALGVVYECES